MLAAIVAISSVLSIVATAPSKSVIVSDSANEIDGNGIFGKQVGASWGGYSASAGLGGNGDGGVLFAGANTPNGHSAAAGLGGTSGGSGGYAASAGTGSSAGAAGASGAQGGGFFDHIFAIPIGVLQSVNKFLNNRGNQTKVVVTRHDAKRPAPKPQYEESSSGSSASSVASSEVYPPFAAGAAVNVGPGVQPQTGHSSTHVVYKGQKSPEFYDNVFDIPISALRSVNQLLNGGRRPS